MTSTIFTAQFWKGALERALKTTAQAAVAAIGVNQVGLLDVDWKATLSLALAAGVLSILTSIGNGDFTAGAPAEPPAAIDNDEYPDDVDEELVVEPEDDEPIGYDVEPEHAADWGEAVEGDDPDSYVDASAPSSQSTPGRP